mgnify:CR=1 FL=1
MALPSHISANPAGPTVVVADGPTLAHAQSKVNDSAMSEVEIDKLVRLVRFFGKMTRERVASSYRHLKENLDAESWRVAQEV